MYLFDDEMIYMLQGTSILSYLGAIVMSWVFITVVIWIVAFLCFIKYLKE